MQSSSDIQTALKRPNWAPLPVDSHLHEVTESLKSNTLTLLEALPGAGKTTRIPACLLGSVSDTILVLEPRRMAARMAARRVADELGEQPGETVGYRVRFEEAGGRSTRLWYLTEGVLTRRLLSGDSLPDVSVVILDEFHERHLETDLALSLLLRLQQRRSDLKLLLMSATLGNALRSKLNDPPLLRCPGRMFPVEVTHSAYSAAPLEEQVVQALSTALRQTKKDVLIFLPGAAEIRKCMSACETVARSFGAVLHALHGDLSPQEQDQAVKPAAHRKIICSTNVAESSVTIEGVEAVIDSGLARVMTHSAWSGLSRLRLEKVSQASVVQRSGRAGRVGPGMAIRLFPLSDFVRRPADIPPEIQRIDLAGAVLQVAAAGISWQTLTWLDAPPEANVSQAKELLMLLGALDKEERITPLGSQMAELPLHPRLGCFLLGAAADGAAREAADLAARLSEGRLRTDENSVAGFASDLDALLAVEPTFAVRQLRRQLENALPRSRRAQSSNAHALEKALLRGFPDRVAQRRADTLLLANGGSVKLDRHSLARSAFVVALEVDDRAEYATPLVRLAADIKPDWLLDAFPGSIQLIEELVWNREAERVEQRHAMRYRELTLDESTGMPRGSEAAAGMLAEKALDVGIERFTDAEAFQRFLLRIRFAAEHGAFALPEDLVASALREMATGCISFADLRSACRGDALLAVLEARLPMRIIDRVAPSAVTLPSGRRARIEYHEGRPPSVSSRLQDFFGMKNSPTVADGAVALVVHLLAPNQRPVQVTTDLASFWKNLYPQVRRELSRRYPRHSWPETVV